MKYPEHEKMAKIQEESQAQGQLLDWLQDEHNVRLPTTVTKLLAEYHEIDLDLLEHEKNYMLKELRGENDA